MCQNVSEYEEWDEPNLRRDCVNIYTKSSLVNFRRHLYLWSTIIRVDLMPPHYNRNNDDVQLKTWQRQEWCLRCDVVVSSGEGVKYTKSRIVRFTFRIQNWTSRIFRVYKAFFHAKSSSRWGKFISSKLLFCVLLLLALAVASLSFLSIDIVIPDFFRVFDYLLIAHAWAVYFIILIASPSHGIQMLRRMSLVPSLSCSALAPIHLLLLPIFMENSKVEKYFNITTEQNEERWTTATSWIIRSRGREMKTSAKSIKVKSSTVVGRVFWMRTRKTISNVSNFLILKAQSSVLFHSSAKSCCFPTATTLLAIFSFPASETLLTSTFWTFYEDSNNETASSTDFSSLPTSSQLVFNDWSWFYFFSV